METKAFGNKFNEEDIKKFADAINFITKEMILVHDKVDVLKCRETIQHLGHLQTMLKKANDNVLEIKRVIENKEEAPQTEE